MNNEAVLRLFDTYADDAFRLAYTYLGSRPDAEDVVQDVFVKLIRSDVTISQGKEKSYILTMTANRCKDFLKSANVVFNDPFDDAVEAGSETEFDEDDTEMYEAVSELPDKLRVAIHLHYYEGYSLKEIADILDIAPSAVSMRLTRAKDILRKRFMGGSSYAG
ncbi:MAG: sigma-70 family RNA polymerase sigma factor [Clostridiales bacterium]|nr:sigma-70 family RNA polymerase sigma factor [Clostridiales bacterium]